MELLETLFIDYDKNTFNFQTGLGRKEENIQFNLSFINYTYFSYLQTLVAGIEKFKF